MVNGRSKRGLVDRIERFLQRGRAAMATRNADYRLIDKSGLFDREYYLDRNPEIAASGVDPLDHYLRRGWREGREPNPYFDGAWYFETYPEIAASGRNPLVEYLRIGGISGRDPSPRFESAWYLERYPDVRQAGTNPLVHYLKWGKAEGRRPTRPGTPGAVLTPFESWLAVNELSERDIAELRQKLADRSGRLPKISVITPVHDSDPELLQEAVASVCHQIYGDWEMCLVDDGSTAPHVEAMLKAFAGTDARIRVKSLEANGGISAATNAGVAMASGEIVVFLDHDDLLTVDCLAELGVHYADHPDTDIVYSDDDKIDGEGRRFAPQFKPDRSPTLLLSWMYFSHVFSVRKELFERLGGFRPAFDGAQDYDFALRSDETARQVGHISRILYHWRAVEGSTAVSGEAKPESLERGRLAAEMALERRGITGARVIHPQWAARANIGMFDIEFSDEGPSVTVIIAKAEGGSHVRECLKSLEKTAYRNFDVVVLESEPGDQSAEDQLDPAVMPGRVRVLRLPELSVLPELYNEAARRCASEFVLFFDPSFEATEPGWLSQMVGYAQMKDVGAVGARLAFADGTLKEAGIVHGLDEGLAGSAFFGLQPHESGYLGLARTSRECSAVSDSCLLVSRSLFQELGGFDAANFPATYFDVDFCYRLTNAGHTCVYCASAQVRQKQVDDNAEPSPAERGRLRRRYAGRTDRWYNFNLSLENSRFDVDAVRPPTASRHPVRLAAVTHNLENQGAPTTLMDLVTGLATAGVIDPIVLSPVDGPLRVEYERAGVPVLVRRDLPDQISHESGPLTIDFAQIGSVFRDLEVEVVLANTLRCYWGVKAAKLMGIPSIWAQHESEPWESYFDYLPVNLRSTAYETFADPYRVIYVAEATRRAWQPLETRRNFKVIRHGIPPERLVQETSRWTRESARKKLGIPADAAVLSTVGSICRRKGQLDLAEAYAKLPNGLRDSSYVYLAGKIVEPDYAEELREAIADHGARVILTGHIEDPFLYYIASDIVICTSRLESAPRVLHEAMACARPIITTPVFGIPEIVRSETNALFYPVGDADALARAIATLLSEDALRHELGANSLEVLHGQPGFADMIRQYADAIRQAVNLR